MEMHSRIHRLARRITVLRSPSVAPSARKDPVLEDGKLMANDDYSNSYLAVNLEWVEPTTTTGTIGSVTVRGRSVQVVIKVIALYV